MQIHLSVFITIVVLICSSYEAVDKRVINGYDAEANQYPWAVAIKAINPNRPNINYCGATIINEYWLLSAAHCFSSSKAKTNYLSDPKSWVAQAGSPVVNHDRVTVTGIRSQQTTLFNDVLRKLRELFQGYVKDKPEDTIYRFYFKKIILHPKYKSNALEYDIALIKLAKKLPLSNPGISVISLPPEENPSDWPPDDSICMFIGWGCIQHRGGPSPRAKVVSLKVVPNSICSLMYNYGANLNDEHEFCAGYYKSNVGICSGDSGTGLIYTSENQKYVVGVASATHADEPQSYPGLFTRVAYFRSWILQTINSNETHSNTSLYK